MLLFLVSHSIPINLFAWKWCSGFTIWFCDLNWLFKWNLGWVAFRLVGWSQTSFIRYRIHDFWLNSFQFWFLRIATSKIENNFLVGLFRISTANSIRNFFPKWFLGVWVYKVLLTESLSVVGLIKVVLFFLNSFFRSLKLSVILLHFLLKQNSGLSLLTQLPQHLSWLGVFVFTVWGSETLFPGWILEAGTLFILPQRIEDRWVGCLLNRRTSFKHSF